MLKFKWLELEAIGRFVEKQRIDFTTLGMLIQVDALNKNTGGSSGAAKTTIFNAVDFLFGLNNKPTTVLQSRLTKELMTVRGGFDFDGVPLIISRGKKLSIDLDGAITTGSSKLTEEKLDEILGMPRELFRQMLHKRQKEGGFFLKMTPKEIYEFLTSCMPGLAAQAKKVDKLDEKLKVLAVSYGENKNNLENGKVVYEATFKAREALGSAPKCSVDQESILRIKSDYDLATANFNRVLGAHKAQTAILETERPELGFALFDSSEGDRYEKERDDVRAQIQTLIQAERARQDEVKKWVGEFKAELYRLHNQIASGNTAQKEAIRVAAEIKKVRSAICPTCDQSWVTDTIKSKEAQLIATLMQHKESMNAGTKASERNLIVAAEIERLEQEAKPQRDDERSRLNAKEAELSDMMRSLRRAEESAKAAQSAEHNVILNAFAVRQGQLRQTQSLEIDGLRNNVEHNRRALDASVHELKSHATALAKHESNQKGLSDVLAKCSSQIAEYEAKIQDIKAQLIVAEELKRAIKSYISCSFDDALASIGDTATRISRNIPNMANSTIRLVGTKETKDGKVKDEVNAIIDNDGEESIDFRSFCGGEESAIDLAVDLSVIDFVENKTNKGIDVFFLDEPFTGMDTVIIEDALQVLKTANINKRLVIVDHNPEVKQMVESRLLVVRDGTTSKIEQG